MSATARGDGGDRGVGQVVAVRNTQRSELGALVGDGDDRGVGQVAPAPVYEATDMQRSEVGALVESGCSRRANR